MADDNDKSPLTRRRVLGGMATIGAAGALGAGSWAAFSDRAQTDGTFTAGELDGKISYEASYNGETVNSTSGMIQANPDADHVALRVNDLKPGDYGSLVFGLQVKTNPAWVASCVSTENDDGELDEHMRMIPFYDTNVSSSFFDPTGSGPPNKVEIGSGTLDAYWDNSTDNLSARTVSDITSAGLSQGTRDWLNDDNSGGTLESPPDGAPEMGDGCVLLNGQALDDSNDQGFEPLPPAGEGGKINFGYDWSLPYETGNEVQGDKLDIVFSFDFIQARHNGDPTDGSYNPGENASSDQSEGDNLNGGT
ncbi:SipW-dependent-type signal peptide-containing protein [Halococcus thailandensis]|uniref:SipW-cognate class signal peptide n=1 Tax=Halococcus thailandensis JCM 13552 TaxID=1227457 RepID=M0N0Q4_9EURY|nr:SipW-dependent-type signal peptide-containing protein [Halococcus thailandensis]EMA50260.1 hypothetical protein C451_17215 [Halococcus thailandensis JCM 13552]